MSKYIPPLTRAIPREAESYSCAHNNTPNKDYSLKTWLESTTISPISAVEWSYKQGWSFQNRITWDDMWFCIIEGAFSYKLENDSRYCALEVGDIVLIPRGMEHSLKLRSETGKMISVHFMAQVYQSVGLLSILRLHGKVTGGKEILIGRNREMAREFALKEPGWEWLIDGGIKETLILAMRSRQNREAKSIDPTIIRGLVRLQPTLELVRERLHERDLKVEEMARRIFVSEVYLRKLFTRTLGVSPVEYIQRQRISHACSLLKNSDESIQEIASACGFSDQSFFYRVFKKHAGTTPQQYREHTE